MKRKTISKLAKRKLTGKDGDAKLGSSPLPLKRGKTVEQIYQKKTQVEHILLRPDTYVGSIEKQDDQLWVWNSDKAEMESRGLSYVPALYKIFDEILVNAADNLQRDKNMNAINVEIDKKQGRIKVWNNGKGLPIQMHKEHKVFVPELVFGHLLTSDNYNDTEKKVTGGRNGFGAKLTNIFSNRFVVETASKGKRYKQTWTSNMSRKTKPEIRKHSGEEFTCIEFWPDFSKFGMKDLEEDTKALMERRVYDLAGCSGERCTVSLNGKKVAIKTFEDYCALFHSGAGHARAQIGKRWEVLVARSDGDGFQQCSFVNAISTPKGGTHVQHVVDQLVDAISSKASKQAGKGTEIKKTTVKNHLWVFIRCLVENPAFSSQTKEQMTLKASSFGSSCPLSSAFISEVLEKTDIINAVVCEAQAKMTAQMDKSAKSGGRGKRILGIPKLEDANEAGSKNSKDCTLILTEGDSAKALAVAGLAVIGRDRYGVFPLRGKPLNVRDVNQKQIMDNKEIMALVKIFGLTFDRNKNDALRYGHVMIMADQDHDGSHIKGLLINLFHHWWPHLLQGDFMQEFVTPIVKVSKGPDVIQFFTQTEYESWKKKNNEGRGWSSKYYKGLGTSTSAEAKEYFSALKKHSLCFQYKGRKDGELIDMAFNKARADDRKAWMNGYEEGAFVDHSKDTITYEDFVNKELVQFSRYDLMRSVPSMMDGFKPSQRKVLYACFKRNLRSDVKVAQFSGYVGEHSAYHHGEASLNGTIVSMAQDFVGSNNINLLMPQGQFGTRFQGGKDHASARYIYTRLSPLTRMIFSPLDDAVLNYNLEEGQSIEPQWYTPILPMVLVNGAEGIGTGWSTSVPNYDPRAIIENLKLWIHKKKMKPMRPWYRGFTGTLKPSGERGKYECTGVLKENAGGIEITELPVKKWTQDYKEFVQGMLPQSDKPCKFKVNDIREYHTENTVHFGVKMSAEDLAGAKAAGLHSVFKLTNLVSETNLVLFDHQGRIRKYKNAIEIMEEFAGVRLHYYDVRKKYMVDKLTQEKEVLSNRARFIAMIISNKLKVNNRKKDDLVKDLTRLKFKKFGDTAPPRSGFEYLLIMHIQSLTRERKIELERILAEKTKELDKLRKTTIQQLWLGDLDRLEKAITDLYAADVLPVGKNGKRKASSSSKRSGKKGEEDEGEEEEAKDNDELDANPLKDISRWISCGVFKGPSAAGGPAKKKQRKS